MLAGLNLPTRNPTNRDHRAVRSILREFPGVTQEAPVMRLVLVHGRTWARAQVAKWAAERARSKR